MAVYINNVCKWDFREALYRRRSACHDDAAAVGLIATKGLGVIFPTYMNIYGDSHNGGCQHLQQLKLADDAVVRPRGRLRQVSVTIVVDAVGTLLLGCRRAALMRVNRRQQQHWHKHCQ